jgi:hypothetical protein
MHIDTEKKKQGAVIFRVNGTKILRFVHTEIVSHLAPVSARALYSPNCLQKDIGALLERLHINQHFLLSFLQVAFSNYIT